MAFYCYFPARSPVCWHSLTQEVMVRDLNAWEKLETFHRCFKVSSAIKGKTCRNIKSMYPKVKLLRDRTYLQTTVKFSCFETLITCSLSFLEKCNPFQLLEVLFVVNVSYQEVALFKIVWSNGLVPRLFGVKSFIVYRLKTQTMEANWIWTLTQLLSHSVPQFISYWADNSMYLIK